MDKKLEGKVAVITGASKGIGQGIAEVYAKYGAKCVLAARGEKVLELAEHLNNSGFKVTQATVSRDIRELKLMKAAKPGGGSRYMVMEQRDNQNSEKYKRVLQDAFLSMDMAQNILVIKTVSGMANAAGAALHSMNMSEIVGCIAGDDTIACINRTVDDTIILMEKIKKIIGTGQESTR